LVVEFLTLPLAAFVAGIVSFSSPCCVPLVPAYLSYISALPISDLERESARRVMVRAAALFVAGFHSMVPRVSETATTGGGSTS
jgi:cytochrome c-type biogenesis protein